MRSAKVRPGDVNDIARRRSESRTRPPQDRRRFDANWDAIRWPSGRRTA